MDTTEPTATEITELLRLRPAFDAPEHVKAPWMQRKVELLDAVEAVEAQR
jgi:hypothetical protein